jgi:hypothetical protein
VFADGFPPWDANGTGEEMCRCGRLGDASLPTIRGQGFFIWMRQAAGVGYFIKK